MTVFITGCSFEVVPPASKGKVLTTAGYSPDILQPGKYTMWGRDKLIVLQTNTNTYKETVNVVLKDKLTLMADVRFRGRISGTDKVMNSMFNDIAAGEDNIVAFNEVYKVYGKMAVRNKVREIVSQYSVEDVHKNYSRLSKEIGTVLIKALEGTPLEISDVALGSITYPQVVTDAINAAKERDLAIKKEEAQAKIMLTRKKNERALAEANYQIEITKAKAIRDKNKIIGQGVTPELIELRRLEVLEAMAENKAAVFMPVEAMSNTGAQMRMFAKQ
jgi:membrane protease subunit (stomatin/prohibitin family)